MSFSGALCVLASLRAPQKFNICRPKLYLGFQSFLTGCMDVGHDVSFIAYAQASCSVLHWLVESS